MFSPVNGFLKVLVRSFPLPGFLRPREVSDGNNEETVACVRDTSQRVVPGKECCSETESTTRFGTAWVGLMCRVLVHVCDREKEEGHV